MAFRATTVHWQLASEERARPIKIFVRPPPCEVPGRCQHYERCCAKELACQAYYAHTRMRRPGKPPKGANGLREPSRGWFLKTFSEEE